MQGVDPPDRHFVHEDIEGRLVELDDVHAVGLQRAGLLVQQARECHRHLGLVAVVAVGHGVDDRHRAGQRDLQLALGVGAGQARFGLMHPAPEPQFAHHLRHHGIVAVVADAHLHLVLEVDSFDRFEKTVHEVLSRLFAIADDRKAGVLLELEPQQRGVGLGIAQLVAGALPLRPQLVGLGQPGRFGQAAGQCGFEHEGVPKAERSGEGNRPRPANRNPPEAIRNPSGPQYKQQERGPTTLGR